jgi:hypothetical protein
MNNQEVIDEEVVVNLRFPQSEFENIMKEVLPNFPDYAMSMRCDSFDYEKHEYSFVDEEEGGEEYHLDLDDFTKAYMKYIIDEMDRAEDKFKHLEKITEPCEIDAEILDCLMQIAIFGEVVYG